MPISRHIVPKLAPWAVAMYGVHMVTKTPVTVTASLGQIVDYELRKKRISRSEAAAKLGIGRETLRRRIEGSQGFTMDELSSIASLLDSTPSSLVSQAEKFAAASNPPLKATG